MVLLARLDRLPLSRPHYALLLIGGLGYTFGSMDAAVAVRPGASGADYGWPTRRPRG